MSRLVRNTSAVAAAFVANTLLSFLQIKLLTRYLSQFDIGEYSTTVAIGAILSVLAQVGLPTVVLRFTAKYDALGQRERIGRLLVLGWGIVLALALLLLVLVAFLAPRFLPRLYAVPPAPINVLLATAVWLAVALRQVTYAGFDGLRRMVYPAVLENVNVAAITTAILIARDQLTVSFLLWVSLISGVVISLIATVLVVRLIQRPPAAPASPAQQGTAPPLLADIRPFWWGAAVNGIIGIGFGYADKLLASLFLSFQMVSIFFVAERITFMLKRLLAVPLQVSAPEITRRWELARREELRHDAGFLLKLQFALGVLVTSLVFIASEAAVLLVANSSFLSAAGLLRVLTLSVALMAFYTPITTLLRAIERIDLALLSDILWLGLYVGLGILLMPRQGLMGIVLAHVAASAVTTVWNVATGHRVGRIAWDIGGLARVLACGLLCAGTGYAATRFLGSDALPAALAIAIAVLIVYNLLLVWSGALTRGDRRRLRELAGSGRLAGLLDLAIFWPARFAFVEQRRPTSS